ncbi:tyrosine-type recombinase/integrase [Paucibacter soli]|uniref:tyrosine-type recombinase/integrase n=1 Tax=Paucibacter soli TaxID=3133433 RepID=UPI0030971657
MARIEKRGDLQWRARVRRDGIEESRTFLTKADAVAWAQETELAISRGQWRDTSAAEKPFAEVAKRYLEEVTCLKRSAKSEEYRIKTLIAAPELRRPIGTIQAAHVAAFRDRRAKEPAKVPGKSVHADKTAPSRKVSAQTVIHELNTLSAIFEHARGEWSIPLTENPVSATRKPVRAKPRERRISPVELGYLQRAGAASLGMREIISLAIETTMRLGELLSLRWAAVDLQKRTAHLTETKNGESRTVALSTAAVAILKDLKAASTTLQVVHQAGEDRPAKASSQAPQALALFRMRKEGRVFQWSRSDSFEKAWKRCLERARALYQTDCAAAGTKPDARVLADLPFHTTRHEGTSRLFERGLNPFEVASMTGHKSMQMLKRYTHVEAEKLATKLG